MVTDTREPDIAVALPAPSTPRAGLRDGAREGPDEAKKVAAQFRLSPSLKATLDERARADGVSISAIGEKALAQYLTGAALGQIAEVAAPLIEEAARRAVADELREIKAVLAAHYTLIERTWREAGMTRLEAFALLGNHYGTAYAEQIEGIAEGLVDSALTQGARVARLNLALEADEEADDE